MAETSDAAPAAEIELSGSEVLASLTPTQREQWYATGELPDRTPEAAKAPESPAPEAADEKADQPAPEAAKPGKAGDEKPVSKRQQAINDYLRRAVSAELRNQELEQRIAALETGQRPQPTAQPTGQPTGQETQAQAWQRYKALPGAPREDEFETYGDFVAAMSFFVSDQRDRERAELTVQQQARQAQVDRLAGWNQRAGAYAAAHPGYTEKVTTLVNRLQLGTPIGDLMADSDVGPQLAEHFADHPEDFDRIVRLPPLAVFREFGKLEQQITAITPATAAPAPKTVTSAPAPPPTLGTRPAEPADEADAALAAGDFARYEAIANQRDLARFKR